MALNKRQLNDELRAKYLKVIAEQLGASGEEILITGSGEFAFPCVDSEGNDEFVVVTVKVPTGSRDGEPYDGYAMAQDYQMKSEAKVIKAQEAKERKERKIEKDRKMREAKAEAKAKHEAQVG